MARAIDGHAWPLKISDEEAALAPIIPTKRRVEREFAALNEYPCTITPRSIEAAVRLRVADGMDVFEAYRQVLGGVARWSGHE